MQKTTIGIGAFLIVAVVGAGYFLTTSRTIDKGGNSNSSIAEVRPPENNQLKVVEKAEADRRATVNKEVSDTEVSEKDSHQSQAVIVEKGDAEFGDLPPEPAPKEIIKEVIKEVKVPVEKIVEKEVKVPYEKIVEKEVIVYRDRPTYINPSDKSSVDSQILGQINSISNPTRPRFTSFEYKRAAKVKPKTSTGTGAGSSGASNAKSKRSQVIVARTGDAIYGRLDRGFNSDDPQAPIVITLYDLLNDNSHGALHGARVVGNVAYSQYQSAINFTRLVMPNGREYSINAIAVDAKTARTGIASKTDKHLWQRYGGLFLSSLIQGVGNVGQQLVQNNTVATVTDSATVVTGGATNYLQAGMAAIQPLGQALSQAANQNFNRAPTYSAPIGTGVGVVFMDPVIIDKSSLRKITARR